MGTSVDAHCYGCGYDTDVMIGGGRSDFQTFASWPVNCGTCRAVTAANALEQPLKCLECSSENVEYLSPIADNEAEDATWDQLRQQNMRRHDPAARPTEPLSPEIAKLLSSKRSPATSWGDLALSKGTFVCPKCSAAKLRFGTVFNGTSPMMWD